MTYAEVSVTGPASSLSLKLLVDTGSLLTWIARDSLQLAGVKPTATRRFRTIEGRELARETGEALLGVMGEEATRIVVFGEVDDAEVLGADALEGLGLEIDYANKSLRKTGVFVTYAAV